MDSNGEEFWQAIKNHCNIYLTINPTDSYCARRREEAAALSNSQVLMIASLAAILVYFLVNKFLASRQAVFPTSIICLASFTGLVHILLGLEDSKLLLGGIGVMGLIALPMVINLDEQKARLVKLLSYSPYRSYVRGIFCFKSRPSLHIRGLLRNHYQAN